MPRKYGGMTIEITSLALQRGTRWLYEDINLQIKPGEVIVLRGANGSGKSSLLRAIAGFLPLAEGEILYQGSPLKLQAEDCPIRASWYGQSDGLSGEFTARQNLAVMAGIHGAPQDISAIFEKDIFSLSDFLDIETRFLSTGQRQRLALSGLYFNLGEKSLWLLDEPNSGLDVQGRTAFEKLLSAHQQKGGYAVIASHIPLSKATPHTKFDIGKAVL